MRCPTALHTAGLNALSAGTLVRDCAAVASSRAGELYGMQMMDQGIQDDQDNFTYGPAFWRKRRLLDSLLLLQALHRSVARARAAEQPVAYLQDLHRVFASRGCACIAQPATPSC